MKKLFVILLVIGLLVTSLMPVSALNSQDYQSEMKVITVESVETSGYLRDIEGREYTINTGDEVFKTNDYIIFGGSWLYLKPDIETVFKVGHKYVVEVFGDQQFFGPIRYIMIIYKEIPLSKGE